MAIGFNLNTMGSTLPPLTHLFLTFLPVPFRIGNFLIGKEIIRVRRRRRGGGSARAVTAVGRWLLGSDFNFQYY